jgi:hypothetical protein
MRIRFRLVAAIAAVVIMMAGTITIAVSGPEQRAAAAPLANSIAQRAGINPGSRLLWEGPEEQGRDLDAIAATGARWVSMDIDWNSIQGNGPGTWWWVATDRLARAARDRGLSIHGGLAYAPQWAEVSDCPANTTHCLPQDVNTFATFAAAAVARYGANAPDPTLRGTISAWSIWNEPNHQPFALPYPDVARYTAMLGAAYPAIKAADPAAVVIAGGTAPAPDNPPVDLSPVTWYRQVYAQIRAVGGNPDQYFDAVGHHPYSFPTNPLVAESWNAYTQVLAIHQVMAANGDGEKKIWGTESGGPTGTDPVALTDTQQAQWVRDYYRGWNTPPYRDITGPLLWFQHRDAGTNPADWGGQMGLLRKDWTPKPAYAAFAETMRAAQSRVTPIPGRRTAANPNGGYYVMGADGRVTAYGGAPDYGSPRFGFDIARGLAVMPDGLGYVVLDGWGGLHRYGSARTGAVGAAAFPYWPGWDIARDIAITPDGNGLVVLDGFGGVHSRGSAPRFRMDYWPNWDIARAFAFTPSGQGAYMLDGFGGVHTTGDAVRRGSPYWSGWDVARDLEVTPTGDGYAVLDALGGVHAAGDAPRPGWNLAYPSRRANGLVQIRASYVVAN